MIWIFAFFSKASLSLTLFFAEEKHRCVVFFSRLVVLRKSSIIYNYSIIIVFMYEFLDTCLCSTIRGSDMSHHSVIGTLKMPSFSTKKKRCWTRGCRNLQGFLHFGDNSQSQPHKSHEKKSRVIQNEVSLLQCSFWWRKVPLLMCWHLDYLWKIHGHNGLHSFLGEQGKRWVFFGDLLLRTQYLMALVGPSSTYTFHPITSMIETYWK